MKIERLQGDYVLLRIDTLQLMVSQSGMAEIVHLQNRVAASEKCLSTATQLQSFIAKDVVKDIVNEGVSDSDESNNKGKTTADEEEMTLRFVALSDALTLQNCVPQNRFVVTAHSEMPDVRWCWSEVQLFNNADLQASPIPPLLRTEITPLQAVITLDNDKQAFYCDFKHLLRYLTHH